MKPFARWTALLAIAFAAAAVRAAPDSGIDVRLSVPSQVIYGDTDVVVTVSITNTNRHPVNLLRWQLPTEELEGALFRITREDGAPVPYVGPLIKRSAPAPADHLKLDPGAALHYEVELTGAYELSGSGRYSVEYLSRGAHGASTHTLRSGILYLWLEGRHAKVKPPPPPPPPGPSISYTGNCSASQKTTLESAVADATAYANESSAYLGGQSRASPRYVTWFGEYTSDRWSIARGHFSEIASAFKTQALVLDCKCRKPRYYAYVYPEQPYKIFVCGAFWNAPATGTDSRAGTLIHEMSHFSVVAGTDDWAYGQSAAKALADSEPLKALTNADNHEYFSENTPALQ